jgi:hypothetical protein
VGWPLQAMPCSWRILGQSALLTSAACVADDDTSMESGPPVSLTLGEQIEFLTPPSDTVLLFILRVRAPSKHLGSFPKKN